MATLASIAISQLPTKISYYTGDTFDPTGLVVTAIYSDSTTQTVSSNDYTLSTPDMSTAGQKTITVTYTDKTTSFNITVTALAVTSITLSGNYPTTFDVGDTFSSSGLVVTANYNSGTSTVTNNFSVSSPNMSTPGTKAVTVTYIGSDASGTVTATYNITINVTSGMYYSAPQWALLSSSVVDSVGAEEEGGTTFVVTTIDPTNKDATLRGYYIYTNTEIAETNNGKVELTFTPPAKGSYRIRCVKPDGNESQGISMFEDGYENYDKEYYPYIVTQDGKEIASEHTSGSFPYNTNQVPFTMNMQVISFEVEDLYPVTITIYWRAFDGSEDCYFEYYMLYPEQTEIVQVPCEAFYAASVNVVNQTLVPAACTISEGSTFTLSGKASDVLRYDGENYSDEFTFNWYSPSTPWPGTGNTFTIDCTGIPYINGEAILFANGYTYAGGYSMSTYIYPGDPVEITIDPYFDRVRITHIQLQFTIKESDPDAVINITINRNLKFSGTVYEFVPCDVYYNDGNSFNKVGF